MILSSMADGPAAGVDWDGAMAGGSGTEFVAGGPASRPTSAPELACLALSRWLRRRTTVGPETEAEAPGLLSAEGAEGGLTAC